MESACFICACMSPLLQSKTWNEDSTLPQVCQPPLSDLLKNKVRNTISSYPTIHQKTASYSLKGHRQKCPPPPDWPAGVYSISDFTPTLLIEGNLVPCIKFGRKKGTFILSCFFVFFEETLLYLPPAGRCKEYSIEELARHLHCSDVWFFVLISSAGSLCLTCTDHRLIPTNHI